MPSQGSTCLLSAGNQISDRILHKLSATELHVLTKTNYNLVNPTCKLEISFLIFDICLCVWICMYKPIKKIGIIHIIYIISVRKKIYDYQSSEQLPRKSVFIHQTSTDPISLPTTTKY